RAADILRDWDGRMSMDAAAPTIETRARQELVRLLLEPKLGALASGANPSQSKSGELTWKSYRWGMSSVWLENVLSKEPARWLPSGYSDYGSLLTTAVENVVRQAGRSAEGASTPDSGARSVPSSGLSSGLSSDLSQWKWGNTNRVEIDHPLLSKLPLIGRFTGPGSHPISGSGQTVKQVGRELGPSERATWSFASFDESTLNLVTGESGIFLSPYYMDQWAVWWGGSTFAFPFSRDAVERHRAHQMTLVPK